jgi:hypothetical protein
MIFWIKQENYGDAIRLEDISWRYSVYLAADDKSDLNSILREENIAWLAAGSSGLCVVIDVPLVLVNDIFSCYVGKSQ